MKSWLRKIIKARAKSEKPSNLNGVLAQLPRCAAAIQAEIDRQRPILSLKLAEFESNPLMGASEQAAALESVYWAITLIRLIEKAEQGWIPQSWLPQLLNDILLEMESLKRGCKVRFARQMLQEYAEIQSKKPELSYQTEALKDYFICWLWECLKKPTATRPELVELQSLRTLIEPYLEREIWV